MKSAFINGLVVPMAVICASMVAACVKKVSGIELLTSNVIDLGNLPENTHQRVEIPFRNHGPEECTIRSVRKSCGCIDVSYPTTALAAGSDGVIVATADTGPGARESVRLTVIGTCKNEFTFDVTIRFHVDYLLRFSPDSVNLRGIRRGDRVEGVTHLIVRGAHEEAVQAAMRLRSNCEELEICPQAVVSIDSGDTEAWDVPIDLLVKEGVGPEYSLGVTGAIEIEYKERKLRAAVSVGLMK